MQSAISRYLSALRVLAVSKRGLAVIGSVLTLYAGASAIASFGDQMLTMPQRSGRLVDVSIDLASLDEQTQRLQTHADLFTYEENVRAGDSLSSLLARLQVGDGQAQTFLRTDPLARSILQLRPGRAVVAQTDAEAELHQLRFLAPNGVPDSPAFAGKSKLVVVEKLPTGFKSREQWVDNERRVEMRSGEVVGSLYAATDEAGVPDAITQQMVDIFESAIDFHSDLRRGDTFRVVYESYWLDGAFVKPGRILAIEFVNQGRSHRAAWFENNSTSGGYYSFDGRNVHKAFLRSPLEFSRVSSGFSGSRLNPVSQLWKAHRGVDYAAPMGTSIRTVADGTVDFAGWQNGYGNVVIVKHSGAYETVYAHMSGFAPEVKKGARVGQGQTLGYVGMTGWATGPHLHFEFHIDGQPQNPLAVALPEAAPILAHQRSHFDSRIADFQRRFALLTPTSAPALASR